MTEQTKTSSAVVLVPREPTREMLNGVCMHPDLARSLWSSMIKHAPAEQPTFAPTEVVRDEDGYWYHPGIPDFGGDEDPAPYIAWMAEQGLERKGWHMDSDLEHHPYYEGEAHCNGWDPQSPGPEWFLTGIFDTDDGPYVSWARRLKP